ncbi:hypothetical protein ACFWUU_30180 [Kribbella sp. NPDC058693]|uniref:hypothetical protein n=1 Tax=Kribbella sp. NPDC058693 TaxID=3346602 RepID=UPI0036525B0A
MKVTSFRELMREQANAAVRISGAHHSSWNQKFKVAAEAMYDASRLPELMPPDQRDQAVARIAAAMNAGFARVAKLPESADAEARRAVGMQAAADGSKMVSRLKKQWQMPAPNQRVQRGAEQRRTAQPERGDGPQSPAPSAPTPASPAAPTIQPTQAAPALPPDIAAAARAGLSGPPLASASRLSAERQGARGAGATAPAAQRQAPETQR